MDRRRFLTMAGLGALGAAAAPGMRLFRPGEALAAATAGGGGGRRWAMVVDLRRGCPEDCRACTAACHTVHNVPDFGNRKDEIKWIWKTTWEHAFPGEHQEYAPEGQAERPVMVLCNHCEKPPCVRVCPTKATYRRPDGIVMMDFHRCIGCRFCMAGCPYGSRSFNWRDPRAALPGGKAPNPAYPTRMRGVVEKCTFCSERLDRDQIPACVEACEEKLLAFGDLRDGSAEVRRLLAAHFTVRRKVHLGTQPQVYYIV